MGEKDVPFHQFSTKTATFFCTFLHQFKECILMEHNSQVHKFSRNNVALTANINMNETVQGCSIH